MIKTIGFISALAVIYIFAFQSNDLDLLMEETYQEKTAQSGLKVVSTTDLHGLSENGMFTVVEFYTDSCSPCKKLKKNYDKFLPLRPDVAVRRIQLPNNWTIKDASEKYSVNIKATPHVLIFNKNGELMQEDDGRDKSAYVTLQKWIYATLKANS